MNAAADLPEHAECHDCGEPVAPDQDYCDDCAPCPDCAPRSQCYACADDVAYSAAKDER